MIWLSRARATDGQVSGDYDLRTGAGRLSMTTISPRLRVGTRHCSTYARKVSPLIAPLIIIGAVIRSQRSAATKVNVFQAANGTRPHIQTQRPAHAVLPLRGSQCAVECGSARIRIEELGHQARQADWLEESQNRRRSQDGHHSSLHLDRRRPVRMEQVCRMTDSQS